MGKHTINRRNSHAAARPESNRPASRRERHRRTPHPRGRALVFLGAPKCARACTPDMLTNADPMPTRTPFPVNHLSTVVRPHACSKSLLARSLYSAVPSRVMHRYRTSSAYSFHPIRTHVHNHNIVASPRASYLVTRPQGSASACPDPGFGYRASRLCLPWP